MNAPILPPTTLDDKYLRDSGSIYLTGVQALVRLALVQKRADRARGFDTGGFISGYRGSPLGTLDRELWGVKRHLAEHDITFQPGLNEDLAATAVWGSQQVGLFPGPRHEGVFAMWYAKAPGVDRSGDALRHANYAGTAARGGVLALVGDDHACKSASLPSQSDWALRDACIPILNPVDVADVLRLGRLGWEMSRFSGLWTGMKCLADTMDSAASVDLAGMPGLIALPGDAPDIEGGVSIRWPHAPLDKERLVFEVRLPRAIAFARANGINRVVRSDPGARLAIVAIGKSAADVAHALRRRPVDVPIKVITIGMPWPLDTDWLTEAVSGCEGVLIVEEKRALVEEQLVHALYRMAAPARPRLLGKTDEAGRPLLPAAGALSVEQIELAIDRLVGRTAPLQEPTAAIEAGGLPKRLPYFCSGCPHNRSTKVIEGSQALAGIGCHYMAQWMDRDTITFSQMGSEGTTWIGIAPFTETRHVFVNLGDGTYAHSGLLAIRAARAAQVNITYKLLYNDAVAMTGGQQAEGGFTVPQIVAQLRAEGITAIEVVAEEPGRFAKGDFPADIRVRPRSELALAERRLREEPGVSAIIYDQVCAAEKRRRRKRGLMPLAPARVLINEAVCEGCGDCGQQSNCVSLVPVETPLGRKRQIEQAGCNQDQSCVDGFCPSFVTVEGGTPAKASPNRQEPPTVPEPSSRAVNAAIVINGIGGTGIVTIGAVLGMAAHLDGLGTSVLDMIGLSQKGGEVTSHVRLQPRDVSQPPARVGAGEASVLLGCDLLGAAGGDNLRLLAEDAIGIVNTAEVMPGEFTRQPDLAFPAGTARARIDRAIQADRLLAIDAMALAEQLVGDAVGANMLVLGAAWQRGGVPVSEMAIRRAIELNGVAVKMNLAAFAWGRAIAHDPALAQAEVPPLRQSAVATVAEIVAVRRAHLEAYGGAGLAARYGRLVEAAAKREAAMLPHSSAIARAVAEGYHKLLAYKDEYEVARLLSDAAFLAGTRTRFGVDARIAFHLAPPLLPGRDAGTGRPRKRRFGPWLLPVLKVVAALRPLRGTPFDPFGYTAERKAERAAIPAYEAAVEELMGMLSQENAAIIADILRLPLQIRGFGPVKDAARARAVVREKELRQRLIHARAPVAIP